MERFVKFSNRVYCREGVLKQTRTGVTAVLGEKPSTGLLQHTPRVTYDLVKNAPYPANLGKGVPLCCKIE